MKNFKKALFVCCFIFAINVNAQDKKVTWKSITEKKDERIKEFVTKILEQYPPKNK